MNTDFLIRRPCSNKTLGIEIEGFLSEENRPALYEYHGFWYATDDGSIRTPSWLYRSIEFVSQPLVENHLKREVRKLFAKYNLESNDSCGVHIHASRKWVSKDRAEKIWAFIQTLDRGEFDDLFGREPNEYCTHRVSRIRGERYRAINTTNKATIEFRMFNSGNAAWCQYCIDMVVYMIENANHLNLDAIYAFRDLTARKYSL